MAKANLSFAVSPFALSFVAGLPVRCCLFAGLGSFLGYFFLLDTNTFGYIAATVATVTVRLIVSRETSVSKDPLWSAIIAGGSSITVGIIANIDNLFPNGLLAISGSVMAAVGAYSIRVATNKRNLKAGFSSHTLSLTALAVNLIFTGLFSVTLGSVSVGRILALTIILIVGRFARSGGGAVFGISAAVVSLICNAPPLISYFFAVGGLLSATVHIYGKIAQSLTLIATASIFVIHTAASATSITITLEAFIASIVFLFIPKDLLFFFSKAIAPPTNIANLDGLRKSLSLRLQFSSSALSDVSHTVDEVSKALSLNTRPDFGTVLQMVEREACKGCSFCIHCWEHSKKDTTDAILAMADSIKKSEPIELAAVPENFAERCLRRERFENVLYKHYTEFLSLLSADGRIREMREIVSDQFRGISSMLLELSNEFKDYQQYDVKTADRVANALRSIGLSVSDCGVVLNKSGRMNIEIKLDKLPDFAISRSKILTLVNDICEREFEPPHIKTQGKECFISISEKAVFTADISVTQVVCKQGKYCGDTAKYFNDGKGKLIMLLSDGMGTGGIAAVDSAMTVALTERLLYSGFGYDCTLKIVNSAMLYKSSDESFSTVDITSIDLFSGKTELYKAGAAPTIVRRNKITGKAECRSLPIGILKDVGFDRAAITLKEGDIVLMMSDGVCSDSVDWICEIVESFEDERAKVLSDRIAAAAVRRRSDGHEDDITVMAAIIEKSV